MNECYANYASPNMLKRGQTLCVIMTEQCNLQCKYCYIKQNPEVISDEVIDQTITFVLDMVEKDPSTYVNVDLFGGEPLLAQEKVKYLITQAQERVPGCLFENGNIKITIFTNCTTLTEDFLKFTVDKKFVKYNFSLDGGKNSQNATRVYASGEGSYDKAMEGLQLYAKIYNKPMSDVYPQWTLSADNVQYVSESVQEMLDRGLKVINVYPMREGWTEETLVILDEQMKKLNDLFIERIDERLYFRGFLGPAIKQQDYERRKQNNINRSMGRYCGAGTNHICISPKGIIYPCQRFYTNRNDEFIMGNIFDGFDKDEDNPSNVFFKNYSSNIYPKCTNCKITDPSICEGQCIAAVYEQTGCLTAADESPCGAHAIMRKYAMRSHEALKDNPHYQKFIEHESKVFNT